MNLGCEITVPQAPPSVCRCDKCGSVFLDSLGAKQFHAKRCSKVASGSAPVSAVAK